MPISSGQQVTDRRDGLCLLSAIDLIDSRVPVSAAGRHHFNHSTKAMEAGVSSKRNSLSGGQPCASDL
jgi:hypothetical protein